MLFVTCSCQVVQRLDRDGTGDEVKQRGGAKEPLKEAPPEEHRGKVEWISGAYCSKSPCFEIIRITQLFN